MVFPVQRFKQRFRAGHEIMADAEKIFIHVLCKPRFHRYAQLFEQRREAAYKRLTAVYFPALKLFPENHVDLRVSLHYCVGRIDAECAQGLCYRGALGGVKVKDRIIQIEKYVFYLHVLPHFLYFL